jgi:gamma-glutamylcyclotransferase (GGCT)/AIG2-like uncharacterized protein YtfP
VRVRHLFVYGTLRSTFTNRHAQMLAIRARLRGPARVKGRLYRLENYPAMRRSKNPGEWVVGEIYELNDPAPVLEELDEYEGPEYARVMAHAVLENEDIVPAWVYEYRRALPESQRIWSGDYLER